MCRFITILTVMLYSALFGQKTIIRVGHFPNITHAQAVIGHAFSRTDKKWFESRLGEDVEVQWYVYNAGPSVMEAIFAGSIDLAYVGPSPTINAYVKSKGEEVRIVCGSCSGGAALVVRKDAQITTDEDFRNKKVGTPQLGNTQDVAARSWLKSLGFSVTLTGGDVLVIPSSPASQFQLFKQGDLDASWSVEPWVSRLLLEGGGQLYFEESKLWSDTDGKYVTTHVVSRKDFLKEQRELVNKWIKAHIELTEWIREYQDEAREYFSEEIKKEIYFTLPQNVMDRAWDHIELTYNPIRPSLYKYAEDAYKIGFIREKPDLSNIYDLSLLKAILKEQGKTTIIE